MNGFLHKLSPCPLYVIFNWEKKYKKKIKKEGSEKKTLYMLYISLSH